MKVSASVASNADIDIIRKATSPFFIFRAPYKINIKSSNYLYICNSLYKILHKKKLVNQFFIKK